jgi:curved DNA-binding protein CbpA
MHIASLSCICIRIRTKEGETELFIDIQSAYENLSDPDKKADYDKKLGLAGKIDAPLNIRTYFSQSSLVRLDEPQLVYSLIEVNMHPETGLLTSSAPLNIALVVDCSTSMQGIRLDTVKSTAIELIRQLHSDDIFIAKFNDLLSCLFLQVYCRY